MWHSYRRFIYGVMKIGHWWIVPNQLSFLPLIGFTHDWGFDTHSYSLFLCFITFYGWVPWKRNVPIALEQWADAYLWPWNLVEKPYKFLNIQSSQETVNDFVSLSPKNRSSGMGPSLWCTSVVRFSHRCPMSVNRTALHSSKFFRSSVTCWSPDLPMVSKLTNQRS